MILTDTHTHLYYETDQEKRKQLIERCLQNDISRLFLPNVDSKSIELVTGLVAEYPDHCYAMMGLHPCDVKENYQEELALIHEAALSNTVYAIGEIGIDLYWEQHTLEWQKQAFRTQIGWAKEMGLPIVIHCRNAFDEVYEVLAAENDDRLRGIFHCFGGTAEEAQKIIALGLYLGIGGIVTYKKAGLDQVLGEIDMKHIVLETDSPYLTPVPYRGKPNESSYLIYVARKVAEIKNISLEEVAAITTENSKIIFGV